MRPAGIMLALAALAVAPGMSGMDGYVTVLSPGQGTSIRVPIEDDTAVRKSAAALAAPARNPRREPPLRVCADPNNLPYSNDRGEGFENRLAELIAEALGTHVDYTWRAQRRGFLRQTLNAGRCDVVMGVPMMDMVGTTRPYYRSGYVFVTRAEDGLEFSSMDAPELKELKIGAHLVGDDGANPPPVHALAERGITDNVAGYMIYGDYREEAPPMRLFDALVDGEIDVAAAWGPQAGWYAKNSEAPLRIVPITDTVDYLPLVFQFSIGMGVRKEDEVMKAKLEDAIVARRADIRALLESYGVPIL